MNHQQIIKRAWELVRNNRFLWWLGLAGLFAEGGGGSIPNMYSSGGSGSGGSSSGSDPEINAAFAKLDEAGRKIFDWISVHPIIVLSVVIFLFLLFLAVIYIAYSAKAGLIIAADSLEEGKKEHSFWKSFRQGRAYAWRLIGFNILLGLTLLALFAIAIIFAVTPLALGAPWAVSIPGVFLGVVIGILTILLAFVFTVMRPLSERSIVLKAKGIRNSFKYSYNLLKTKFSDTAVTWVYAFLIGILYGVAIVVATLLVVAIFAAIGVGIYFAAGEIVTIVYTGVALLLLLLALYFVNGVCNSFISTYWTISFRALDYLAAKTSSAKSK